MFAFSPRPEYPIDRDLERLARKIDASMTRNWTIMEASGEQTRMLFEHGVDSLLPEKLNIVHGPGCPIAAVPVDLLDHAISLARRPAQDVILCTPNDFLRLPGRNGDLLQAKMDGHDLRVVHSSMDALKIAREQTDGKKVVYFNAGFAPSLQMDALAVWQARKQGIDNFFLLSSHASVPAVLNHILAEKDNIVDAILAPGQICTITGFAEYEALSRTYGIPIAVTGFDAKDILEGILKCVSMLEGGRSGVDNQYKRAVNRQGNVEARALIDTVFEPATRLWRGLGGVANGGFTLRAAFADYDALRVFPLDTTSSDGHCQTHADECISHEIIRGLKKPSDCPYFGKACKPDMPLGATMISAQGSCSAYYQRLRAI